MKLHKQGKSCGYRCEVLKQLVECHCKRPVGRLGGTHAKSSDQGVSLRIEPRVTSDSIHNLRLSRVRVRESLEGVNSFSYSGFR